MTSEVFITRSAAYLPGAPVSNDEMESVLGKIGGKPSRARRLVLRNNGITSRHYALDPTSGEPLMTHAQLTAAAIHALGEVGHVDCLATGTSIPDQILPSHGVMVHGELGWPQLEVASLAGICLSGTAALKYAYMSVATGSTQKAVATGSELVSPLMHARHFEAESEYKIAHLEAQPEIAFEKDFLRWMLSDGAGALLLEAQPGVGLSLRVKATPHSQACARPYMRATPTIASSRWHRRAGKSKKSSRSRRRIFLARMQMKRTRAY